MLDTPLSGLGITPLRRTAGGMVMSQTYREALNGLVNACAGKPTHSPAILKRNPKKQLIWLKKIYVASVLFRNTYSSANINYKV